MKEILTAKLANLLGFEDGASDVLDHLLTIETDEASSKDLLEYLSQLLGSTDDKVKAFVADVGRFQRGETIAPIPPPEPPKENIDTKPSVAVTPKSAAQTQPGGKKKTPLPVPASKPSQVTKAKNEKQETVTGFKDLSISKSPKNLSSTKQSNEKNETSEKPPQKKIEPKRPKGPPKRGKASFNCGCFGRLHKPLTNCLYCGRVACEKEGYNFCPFCGYMVEKVEPIEDISNLDEAALRALRHKERLLRYDREHAQRTTIFDDQEDYFVPSTWQTKEEQELNEQKEEERQEKIRKREKMTLNLGL